MLSNSSSSPPNVNSSANCTVAESNGFLKERCPSTFLGLPIFKCPFSDEYYWVVFSNFIEAKEHPLVNDSCSDDPYGYQVMIGGGGNPIFPIPITAKSTFISGTSGNSFSPISPSLIT